MKFIKSCICFLSIAAMLAMPLPSAADGGQSRLELKTVVLDPGHGGKDPGCVSRDRKTYEKNLTLSIARLLGQKINQAYPDVNVIYTRTTDKYITLNDRAEIANRNHADLFISIHINSFTNPSTNGFSAHILGQSRDKNRDLFSNDPESFIFFNLMQNAFYEQSLLFAADVERELSKGPITHSRGISQDPFYVLWKTTMPAVLIEVGFISNAADLRTMNSSAGKDAIADRLFSAFRSFKTKYDGSLDLSSAQTSRPAAQADVQDSGEDIRYGVQILVLSKRLKSGDKALKGYVPEIYPAGKVYKYVVGISSSEDEARDTFRSVRRRFPDSFPVKIIDGKVSPL